jgi:branched-chain amino acid aminotransferase
MIVASPERIPMGSFDQTVKNYMWGDLTASMIEAGDRGAKVSMLLDRDGNVTEGPGFNVFAVAGGRLMTPDTGVLHGITRRTAIELAQGLNIETRIAPVASTPSRRPRRSSSPRPPAASSRSRCSTTGRWATAPRGR